MGLLTRLNDNITLVTANDSMLTSRLVLLVVLLEHLRGLAAIVGALDGEVVTLFSMLFKLGIGYGHSTAFCGVLTLCLDDGQLLREQWMRFHKSHIWRTT